MKRTLDFVFTAFAVITFGLALLMGPLWSLRENPDTNNILGMVGVAGVCVFLFNVKRLSLFKVALIAVSFSGLITYLDQAMGFWPGLYPMTLFFGSVTLFLGIALIIGKDIFYSIVFSVGLGVILWRILLITDPWWLWYVDKHLFQVIIWYALIIETLSLLIDRRSVLV